MSKAQSRSKSVITNISSSSPNSQHIDISIIIPAYNERERIQYGMKKAIQFIKSDVYRNKIFEIIVVDDGSKDTTYDIALNVAAVESKTISPSKIRVRRLPNNQGKGGAIKAGVLIAQGDYILFADADGATEYTDLPKLLENTSKYNVIIGSRAHLEKTAIANRKWYRNLLMYLFHLCVWIFGGVSNVKDTQCGFKLFQRETAVTLFKNLHIYRFAFDVELLAIAQKLKIPVKEVAVTWNEMPGSTVTFKSMIRMGIDLLRMRFAYLLGLWSVTDYRISFQNEVSSPPTS